MSIYPHIDGAIAVYCTALYGRFEAHSGDAVGYSQVSRSDALQALLTEDTQSQAVHPHDWPERGTPVHAQMAMLRGVK